MPGQSPSRAPRRPEHPQASHGPTSSASELAPRPDPDISARLHSIRETLRRERELTNAANAARDAGRRVRAATPPYISSRLRMRAMLRHHRDTEADELAPSDSNDTQEQHSGRRWGRVERDSYPSGSSTRSRGRRSSGTQPQSAQASLSSSFQDLEDRLAQANQQLRSLLDTTPLPPGLDAPHQGRTRQRSRGDESGGRRKRRRLNHPLKDESEYLPRIEYGYEGQVVAGKLKMQLLSTHGAENDAHARLAQIGTLRNNCDGYSWAQQNILTDDETVYSTKSPYCNLLLAHQGETTFTVDRLVIQAPKSGYTAPLQEGIIFASVDRSETFERTLDYPLDDHKAREVMQAHHGNYLAGRDERLPNSHTRPSRSTSALDASWPPLVPMSAHQGYASDSSSDSGSEIDQDDDEEDDDDIGDDGMIPVDIRPTDADDRESLAQFYRQEYQEFERFISTVAHNEPGGDRNHDIRTGLDIDELLRRGESTVADRRRRRLQRRAGRMSDLLENTANETQSATEDDSEQSESEQSMEASARDYKLARLDAIRHFILPPLARFSMRRSRPHARFHSHRSRIDDTIRTQAPFRPGAALADWEVGRALIEEHRRRYEALRPRDLPIDPLPPTIPRHVLPPVRPPLHRNTTVLPPIGQLEHIPPANETIAPAEVDESRRSSTHNLAIPRRMPRTRVRTSPRGHKTVVHFEPPLDSRYLLVKLWNPDVSGGQINVRSIKVYGWAGVRWVPAVEMR